MAEILRIHHAQITIPPEGEAAARDFYCGVLGLTEIEKPAPLRSRGGFWLQAGASELHVGLEADAPGSRTRAHVAYEVDDLDALRQRLLDASCSITDGDPIGGRRRFETRDPLGNRVEFLEAAP